jgi:hypothetical protein
VSYGGVENTQEELDLLVGATILSIKIEDLPEDLKEFGNDNKIVMRVKVPKPVVLDGKETGTLSFEVWQDEEGNGPGYFALVGD